MKKSEIAKRVSELLHSEPFRVFKAKEIARRLHISSAQYRSLKSALYVLVDNGAILKFKKNRYGVGQIKAEVTGHLRVNSQGYGFVTPEHGQDVFVSQKNMGSALHKDEVKVQLFASTPGKSPEGRVIEVLERANRVVVGTFRRGRHQNFVVPDNLKLSQDIVIDKNEDKEPADGQKVVVAIEYENDGIPELSGRIVKVLGSPQDPGVDILSVIYSFELPLSFPAEVTRQAEMYAENIPEEELSRRLDLRDRLIITIDPEDAEDFDDAVSLEAMEDGHLQLGIHIADVSHYVDEGSGIDLEAEERGTSVYLVDRVVPMLPERLSTELCSLAEGKDRLCCSVLLDVSKAGDILDYKFAETVINSRKRLSYQQAQKIIDGDLKSELSPMLVLMSELASSLIERRKSRGGIDFESDEVKIDLDERGVPIAINRRERLNTHRLIEEFMLLANQTVARHIGRNQQEPIPFVYRVHEKPDQASLDEFFQLLNAMDVAYKPPKKVTPKFFQKLSDDIKTLPVAPIIQDAMLKAMQKAKYTTHNAGHFGLAYRYYTHFTSPIRRYPDLMVHRLLKRHLSGQTYTGDKQSLEEKCQKSTQREIRAQNAERASVKLKQLEYITFHLGEEYRGIIARIVSFGIFVRIPELLIDGLIHVTSLNDYYLFDEKKMCLTGRSTGKSYRLGDPVTVTVSRVDRDQNLVDFELV